MSKETMYRDRALLDLARDQTCLMRVPGVCRMDNGTTVAAHSNLLRHGKGRSLKAHDAYSVWSCVRCHTWLDESYAANASQKIEAWERAFQRQIVAWRAIASNIAARPRDVKAAREALEWLAKKGEVA